MTDNVAILEGYTREIVACGPLVELHLLIKPDTDTDGWFKAWDTDEQEFIHVAGWQATIEDAESEADL